MCNTIEQCLDMHSTISESRKHTHGINIHLPHQVVLYMFVQRYPMVNLLNTKCMYYVVVCFISDFSSCSLLKIILFYSYFGHSKLAFCFYRRKNKYCHVNEAGS